MSRAWNKENILSPHEESNVRLSDSALRCSSTEPQRLYVERGLCSLSSFYGSLLGMDLTNKKWAQTGKMPNTSYSEQKFMTSNPWCAVEVQTIKQWNNHLERIPFFPRIHEMYFINWSAFRMLEYLNKKKVIVENSWILNSWKTHNLSGVTPCLDILRTLIKRDLRA